MNNSGSNLSDLAKEEILAVHVNVEILVVVVIVSEIVIEDAINRETMMSKY